MNARLFFLIATAALAAVGGCSALRVPGPLAPARASDAPAPPLEVAWRMDAGAAFGRSPVLVTAEGMLVTTRRGEVILVGADGRRGGSVSVGSAVEGPPALVNGRTLIVAVDGGRYGLVALDLVGGSRRWRTLRGVAVDAGVVVVNDVAVVPALDGVVYGVDVSTGAVRWQTPAVPLATFRAAPILLPDGNAVVANTRGTISALDAATGAVQWSADVGAPVEESPAVGEGILVVPTTRGRLVALDAASGATRWTVNSERDYDRFYTPAIHGSGVFVGSSAGTLYALDAASGEVRWRHTTDGHVAAAPLVSGGLLYAGTLDTHVIVLDAATGASRWSFDVSERVKSAPVSLGPLLLVPAEPGVVWAFRAGAQAGS